MKIAHISLFINFLPGFVNTINSEAKSASMFESDTWDTCVVSADNRNEKIEDSVRWIKLWLPFFLKGKTDVNNPFLFYILRIITINFLLFRIIFNLEVNKLTKKYDYVIVRYNSADLLAWLFLKRKEKIIFMFHNRTYYELELYSRFGAIVEKITGRFQTNGCKYIAAVTEEIGKYQCEISQNIREVVLKPNGIFIDEKVNLIDKRHGKLKLLIVASNFSVWIGLDILIKKIKEYTGTEEFELHIVGNLSREQQQNDFLNENNIYWHGVLEKENLEKLYRSIDIGIGTLAFFRSGLNQASTIKVREYLNHGISAVVGYEDFVFPKNFDYVYELSENWLFDDIIEFALKSRKKKKKSIREESTKYISQENILKNIIKQLERIVPSVGDA